MSVSNIWSCLMLYQVKLIKSQRSKSKNTCPTLLQRARRCKRVILIPTHLPNGCSWLSAWARLRVWDFLRLPCSPCLHLPHPGITGLQHHARLLSKNIWCCCHSTHRHRDLKSGSTTEKVALNVLQSTVTCAGDYTTGHKDLQEDLLSRVSVQRACMEHPPDRQ